jgi:adenylate cyclase
LDAFYAFKQQIIDRSSYYQVKYGHVPFFKAGLHCGLITVTEVGKYKREIAYHGDTINTAARIQAKCNEYGVELLVSEELYESLSKERYQFDDKGCVELKGKKKRIELYEVRQKR